MKITIKDIARMAGVSTTTVSLILNDKGDRFSKETIERVRKVVRENNYQPNFLARNMITKDTKTVGVIIPDIKDYFFSQVFEGIESFLSKKGYSAILYITGHSKEKEQEALDFMLSRSVSGIILATPFLFDKKKYNEINQRTPLVLLDRGLMPRTEGKFYVDEYNGVKKAIKYLKDQGHRRIAFIKEDNKYYQLDERFEGFKVGMAENNLPIIDDLIITTNLSVEGGYRGMQELLAKKLDFSVVMGANDYLAIGAYRAIQKAGLTIPNDISVIGFDDIDIAKYVTPSLTTVRLPMFKMGFEAAEYLYCKIKEPEKKIQNHVFSTELITRESVQKIN